METDFRGKAVKLFLGEEWYDCIEGLYVACSRRDIINDDDDEVIQTKPMCTFLLIKLTLRPF